MKKRIVVVCPGRGSYTSETLGYLKKYHTKEKIFLTDIDLRRSACGEPRITDLDNREKFSPSLHTKGEHASLLIYAASYCDFMSIDRDQYEVVAVCGNSMGWYLTLAMAGSLDWEGAFTVIQTMGSMLKAKLIGGQIIYPIVNDFWHVDQEREFLVKNMIHNVNLQNIGEVYISIFLGGYFVIAGDQEGLQFLLKNLPKVGDYPFQLLNHGAFHTPLLGETSRLAFELIPSHHFKRPLCAMIDGRGKIWQPYSTDTQALYEYTLGHQVYAPYDFSKSISVALKEFAPDQLWLLGPGASLSGAIGQVLVQNKWKGIVNKSTFKEKAKDILVNMGG